MPTRNPPFHEDELVLMLSELLRLGDGSLTKHTPEIVELSSVLRELPIHPKTVRAPSFRNPDGIARRMRDLNYVVRGTQPGGGQLSGHTKYKEVWHKYKDDQDELHAEAVRIKAGTDRQGRLRGVLGGVSDKPKEYEPDEEEAAFEGQAQVRFRKHKKRERKKRNEKIESFRREHEGRVYCEVPNCGTDFERQYGVIGKDYAHVHHLDPLGRSGDDGTETRLADLAVVCPNCHAMIHRHGKTRTLDEVGAAIAARQ